MERMGNLKMDNAGAVIYVAKEVVWCHLMHETDGQLKG